MPTKPNAIQSQALGRIVSESAMKQARKGLAPGLHAVDMTVRVTGALRVAEDTSRIPTSRIGTKALMGLFLARSGALRDANLALLETCVGEVIARNIADEEEADGQVVDALTATYEAQYDAIVERFLEGLTPAPVKGAVKADLKVEILNGEDSE